MRKLIKMFAVVALCAPLPVQADPVQAPPASGSNAELIAYCNDVIASGYFPSLNFGECMSFNRTSANGNGFTAHVCDMLLETGELADNGFSSYDDCVRNLQP